MYGILGKPYLNLEPFLDISALVSLHEEISFGLALSDPPRTETGSHRWKDEPRVDVWTHFKMLMDHPHHKKALERLIESNQGLLDKAYLYTQLISGSYTGSKTLVIKHNQGGYFCKNSADNPVWHPSYKHFPGLLRFIQGLPFSEVGQITIFMTENDSGVPIHKDVPNHESPQPNEFIWLSPQGYKRLFIYDEVKSQKIFVQERAVFFNELDYHGIDPCPRLTYSVRVDGRFSDEFRKKIGIFGATMPEMRPAPSPREIEP